VASQSIFGGSSAPCPQIPLKQIDLQVVIVSRARNSAPSMLQSSVELNNTDIDLDAKKWHSADLPSIARWPN
jgi:hypothetical protein